MLIAIDINTLFLLSGTLLLFEMVAGTKFELDAPTSQAVKSVRTRTVAEIELNEFDNVYMKI